MSRAPTLRISHDALIIDNFAGGGGASEGIRLALGRDPDIAINHDPEAIAMHKANHPGTTHYTENVFDVDIVKACRGRRIGLGWYSPDCTYFAKARGGKPFRDRNKARRRRGLAWIIVKHAKELIEAGTPMEVIGMENVQEFADWGPLGDDGRPCPLRKGFTFRRWCRQLQNLGYELDMWELRGCDYGAPTTRERLFIVARYDGAPIRKPQPTHGRGLAPYRTAADCIDWSIPCPSIFDRKRPLAENTLRRIAEGIRRFVIENPRPFIVPIEHYNGRSVAHSIDEPLRTVVASTTGSTFALVSPTLIQTGYGERDGQAPRVPGLDKPLGVVVAGGGKHALVAAFLAKQNGIGEKMVVGQDLFGPVHTITTQDQKALVSAFMLKLKGTSRHGQRADEPLHTIQAGGTHYADVRAFLIRYNGMSIGQGLDDPLSTIDTTDRFGLVTVHGEPYVIADIGMRMLTARELYRAQGFRDDYQIDRGEDGTPFSKTAQIRMCGNSVCPPVAEAIVRAQFEECAAEAFA